MTHISIRPEALAQLEARLPELAPWMHCFKFSDSAFVGYYKVQGMTLGETFCAGSSSQDSIARFQTAYANYNALGPRSWFEKLWGMLDIPDRSKASLIDISSATGEKSFWAARFGFGSVTSSEIRLNQHLQEQLILDCSDDPALRAVQAVHDPVSADHADFPSNYETFDVVCSFGLLYHLENPFQHLRNLWRMSNRYVVLETITHQDHNAKGYWSFLVEDPAVITKATSSISWKPHYLAVLDMARQAGFRKVQVHYPDCFARNFPDYREGNFPANERCRDGLLRRLGFETEYHRRMRLYKRNQEPSYFEPCGLNPNYFYYIFEK